MHLCLQDHTDLTIYLIAQELQVPEKKQVIRNVGYRSDSIPDKA